MKVKGEVRHARVVEHGSKVLSKSKAKTNRFVVGVPKLRWGRWKFKFHGMTYNSPYRSFEEWEELYGPKGISWISLLPMPEMPKTVSQ